MGKIVCVSDTHFQIKEPHFLAVKEFVEWFNVQPFNASENILVQLGDIYHHSNPNPKVHDLGLNWFQGMKFKEKYLIPGNHCYNRSQDSYSIEPLENIEGVEIFYDAKVRLIENLKCLFLPFIYDYSRDINKTQKEYYEQMKDTPLNDSYDLVFHHLEDESVQFGGEFNGIDLSWIKGERIGGHIHKQQKNYLGSSLITRYDEKGKDSFILLIDTETKEKEYVKIPKFLDYYELDYENTFHELTVKYPIFDILNAPSIEAAEEKFKGLYLREIVLKEDEKETNLLSEEKIKEKKSIEEWLVSFYNKNKTPKKIQEKIGMLFNKE